MNRIRLFCFFIVVSIFFGQYDSLGMVIDLKPSISVIPTDFSLRKFSIDINSKGIIPVVFFDPGGYDIAEEYEIMLKKLSEHLMVNPDVILKTRGYYSRSFDNVLSTAESVDIANRRHEAVVDMILKFQPSLVTRIKKESGYDMSALFYNDTSFFDMRAELDFELQTLSGRSILVQDKLPYFRSSYKAIIENILPETKRILSNNPGIYVQIYSSGIPWATDLAGCYKRLDELRSKIDNMTDYVFSDRIVLFADPSGKKSTNVDVRFVFAPLGINIDDKDIVDFNIVFSEKSNNYFVIFPDWDKNIPVKSHSFRRYNRLTGFSDIILSDDGMPEDTIFFKLSNGETELYPGNNTLSMVLNDADNNSYISKKVDINIDAQKNLLVRMCHLSHLFFPEGTDFYDNRNTNLFRIAQSVADFSVIPNKELKIVINTFSEANNIDSDSLSFVRAKIVWEQLSAVLVYRLGLRNIEDLRSYFKKNDIEIFLEPQRESKENKITGSLVEKIFNNRAEIVIELNNEKE